METAGRIGCIGTLLLFSFFVSSAEGESLPLPSFLKACSRNDPKLNECATANAIPAIPKLKNGLPKYGVPPLDPLSIKKIKIDDKMLGLSLDMKDVQLHGLSQSKVKSIRMNQGPSNFVWTLNAPRLVFMGEYEVNGRILLLPINGKGNMNITLDDVEYTFQVNSDLVKKKDGEEYLVPKTHSLHYKLKMIHFNLDNLFNGNKVLGDTMNGFLNENWKDIDEIFGGTFSEEIAVAAKSIIDGLARRVSYDRFLPEKV